jgi:hypothetical protein
MKELRERDERLHRQMILKFGHLSKGQLSARDQGIVDDNQRAAQRNVERIWAEQKAENAKLRALVGRFGQPLRIADRYAAGMRARP